MTFTEKLTNLLAKCRYVKETEHKSYISQLRDIIYLYRKNPSCNVSDYYRFKIYSYQRTSAQYINTLGSGKMESINRALNKRTLGTPTWDKILFAVCCKAYQIPTAETVAVFKERGILPHIFSYKLTSIAEIKIFLTDYQQPLYVKPAQSQQGKGGYWIERYDIENDQIILKGGNNISFDQFVEKTIGNDYEYYNKDAGYLFQTPISQHRSIIDFTGTDVPSGLRIVVLNTNDGPKLHRAVWKVVGKGNGRDNFSMGINGNLIVEVDVATGTMTNGVDDYWPYANTHQSHPATGRKFSEFTIPFWPQIVAQAMDASNALNNMYIMHWDVIVTDAGPVFIKLNDLGGTEILQLHGTPYIDDTLRTHLKNKGYLVGHTALQKMMMN